MKAVLVWSVLVVTSGLVIQQDEPTPSKPPVVQAEYAATLVRYAPSPIVLSGTSSDVYAIALSPDGKRVATVGGKPNPPSGFANVIDIETKKELFSTRFTRPVTSVGFSPDGRLMALAGRDATALLVDATTGAVVLTLKLDGPAHVAFAPDGKSVATATDSKTIQLWEIPSGVEKAKLRGGPAQVSGVAFSPDGKSVAVVGVTTDERTPGVVTVWDMVTQLPLRLQGGPIQPQSVAFAPDGATIAVGGVGGRIRQWELPGGHLKPSAIQTSGAVNGLAYAPGGGILASALGIGAEDGIVRLWDAASGKEIGVFSGHSGICRAVAFSNDGKKLLSAGAARSLKMWDVSAKNVLATLWQDAEHQYLPVPLALAAAADGSLIAIATEDRGVLLRDAMTGELAATLKGHADSVTCVAFSPDGKTLATGSADMTIRFWDVATAKERATLRGHTNWVYAVAFSPDGKTLATGAYDKSVRLWDVATAKECGVIEAHRGSVRTVAFSPDGKTLASGGSDRTIKLWDAATRRLRTTLNGHEGSVRAVAFSPDGKVLASAGEDGLVKLWNPGSGDTIGITSTEHTDEVVCLAFAGPRTVVSGGTDGVIRIWDAVTGGIFATLPGHPGGVTGLATAGSGQVLISAGQDCVLNRWRTEAPGPVRLFTGHTGVVQWTSFSPDGKRFVSCGSWPEGDKTLRVWEVATGREVLKIDHPDQSAMAVFSPDGKFLLSACNDQAAYLWDASTGNQVRSYKGHTRAVIGVAFSPDGSQILTSGEDKVAIMWETQSGRQRSKFNGHTSAVRRVAFAPDGKHAVSSGRDGFVRMWEISTGKEVRTFKVSGNWAECLAISPDGALLAAAGLNVHVWEIATGKPLTECIGHKFGVTSVSFSPDAKYLLSTAYDGSARLWDRANGKELYRLRGHREFLWASAFSPDQKWLLTAGGGASVNGAFVKGSDYDIRLWQMPDAKIRAEFPPEIGK